MNILVAGGGTGGHLMPALAIADALASLRPDVHPFLVGAERGVEAMLLPRREPRYPYYLLPVEPIYRRQWWRNIRWVRSGFRLWRACRNILEERAPTVAVGTGGYAAGPILHFASRRGIPVAIQEQNAFPGVTTRWLAARARQIYLGFDEARGSLRCGADTQIHVLGNPIAPPTPLPKEEGKAAMGLPADRPVCFVIGGSQGAEAINRAVSAALDAGRLDDLAVLWSTGPGTFEAFRRHDAPPHRQVRSFWDPVSTAYAAADIVVARAGAMTTAELCAWGLPSILIPLPTAAANHQTRNAEALAAAGAALHMPQATLDPEGLADRILDLISDTSARAQMASHARERGHPDAARAIGREILALADRASLS